MAEARPTQVIGPLGESLTLADLPAPGKNIRWLARRKAQVVAAVKGGLLKIEDVCERYDVSLDEFSAWRRAVDRSGMLGLRISHLGSYRRQWAEQDRVEEKVRRMTER
jgi:hypothetical protein